MLGGLLFVAHLGTIHAPQRFYSFYDDIIVVDVQVIHPSVQSNLGAIPLDVTDRSALIGIPRPRRYAH